MFLFLPLLAELRFDRLVAAADYPDSKMIPAANALLGSRVNFFHQDCLSSEVRLNVDLDTVLTVVAHGCCRWLASQLQGFDLSKQKCVYRKFVETSGAVEMEPGNRIVVYLDRRSHNPILREANLDKDHPKIPWLGNRTLEFQCS